VCIVRKRKKKNFADVVEPKPEERCRLRKRHKNKKQWRERTARALSFPLLKFAFFIAHGQKKDPRRIIAERERERDQKSVRSYVLLARKDTGREVFLF